MTKAEKNYFFKTKWVKMGQWAVSPADTETWHSEHTSRYFKKFLGIHKGSLAIQTFNDGGEHIYFPAAYFQKLYGHIRNLTSRDFRGLQKKLLPFYRLKAKAHREVPKLVARDYKKLTTGQLIKLYRANRDWAHKITVYDQFGWIGEDYWSEPMEKILIKKFGLIKNSAEYHRVLFVLVKPREISTTLEEKRAVIKAALAIKAGRASLSATSTQLAKRYGWLPVAAFGTPWEAVHYWEELTELLRRPVAKLKKEYQALRDYTIVRDRDIKLAVKKYHITPRDLQIFTDFSLALDGRNEAEYLVSLAGFYLLPVYKEIARRLFLSVNQLRNLYEDEIVAALRGKIDPLDCLWRKGKIIGWGFNKAMTKRINFTSLEAAELFIYLNKTAKNVQGNVAGKGVCASPGIARGIAKIVHSPHENNKVKSGDIMIAHVTMVDYLPAMKKAAAIVTEVGGLTCHAAVVSREFGIPCVVALKDATRNFKDGERVEV
ncbi:MAG TPA: PEP-utilizing enzyme, partial [Patescibacteria group bacterium]|nr:PEP-utilizing enzyme [Patescibacteria group bacterium]